MSARTLFAVCLAASAPPTLAATSSDPLVIVNSLYLRKAPPSHVERLFAADLAYAYRKDTGRPDEVGAIDFDWRYDAQDVKITDLKVFWAPPPDISGPSPVAPPPDISGPSPVAPPGPGKGGGAVPPPVQTPAPKAVEASFRNFGRPHAVFYGFCRTARGELRIADVYSPGRDGWSLRRMLKLDPERVRC